MSFRKPLLYLTWDETGMHLWLGTKPVRKSKGIYRQMDDNGREVEAPIRFNLPVSWFGGLVDEGGCRGFDPEIAFGGAALVASDKF